MPAMPAMPAMPDSPGGRRRRGWPAGVVTAVLLAMVGVLLGAPSTATPLPATRVSTFVPADATRGKTTLTVGGAAVPADLSDARLAAQSVPGAFSPTAYAAVTPGTRALGGTWFREAVVPSDASLPTRFRLRAVDARGVWFVAQDWADLGLTFDGLLELPADVAAGSSWSSSGTAQARPADGDLRFSSTSTARVPDDPARVAEGCLSVSARTELSGPAGQTSGTWTETSLWCPGTGVVGGEGELFGATYAVAGGGAASPVTDADLAPAGWDTSGLASWRLRPRTVVAGDPSFGLVDGQTTPLLDPGAGPVVDASGVVTFPTLEGGDLAGLVARDGDLWAHWWARPGGQVTTTAALGSLVVAPTTAHRVSAYRAGRTLAWNAPLDDAAVVPPLPVEGDALAVATVSGSLTLLDARTGEPRWRTRVGGGVHARLGAGSGLVVTADTTGAVTAWDAGTGRRRWSVHDAANPFATTLLVAGDQVVVAAGATVSAYAVVDGRRTWVREAGLGLEGAVVVGDVVWLGVGEDLQAWSATDGSPRFALAGARPLATAASGCDTGAGLGLARRGSDLVAVDAVGAVRGTWPLPVGDRDVLGITCRGSGVDVTAYAPDGSDPLRVLRLAAA